MEPGSETNQIDGEHRLQLDLANALAQALGDGRDQDALATLVDQFCSFSEVHFAAEHLLMRQYAYPDYQAHAVEHDELIDRLDSLKAGFAAGDQAAMLRTIGLIQAALIGHIRASDERFGRYLETEISGQRKEA